MSGEEEMYDELLGAYALDAVDEDERRAVEDYLKVNPRAVAEVQEHREVAAMLAWSTMAPPDGLWERIAGSLDEAAPVPTGDLARVIPMAVPRRRRLNAVSTWAMAAAAAVVVLALGIAAFRNTSSTTSSQSLMEQAAKRDDAQTVRAMDSSRPARFPGLRPTARISCGGSSTASRSRSVFSGTGPASRCSPSTAT
jgi:anti-sigma factor RsiW